MYILDRIPQVSREAPWCRNTEEKIQRLKEAAEEGRQIVVYLYPEFDGSTFRYRGYNMAEALEYSLQWYGIYFSYTEMEDVLTIMDRIDVLILVRCHMTKALEVLFTKAKHLPITVCYDVDDLICCPSYITKVCAAIGQMDSYHIQYFSRQIKENYLAAEQCGHMITTNPYLAGLLKKEFRKECFVLPNAMNWIQEKVSVAYYEQKQRLAPEKQFHIGYFSGSWTHLKDLMTALPEIWKFLMHHSDARLLIAGYMDLPLKFKEQAEGKIQFLPFVSFEILQWMQAQVDVAVAPLAKSVFTDCKSELKYFEAAAVGTITCASPTFTFSQAIQNGEDGYLCQEGEWYDTLERVYRERRNTRMRKKAYAKVMENYSEKKQRERIEDVLNEICG